LNELEAAKTASELPHKQSFRADTHDFKFVTSGSHDKDLHRGAQIALTVTVVLDF
jgi:hypothetical protein